MVADNYEIISKCDSRKSTDKLAHLNNGSIVLKVAAIGMLVLAFLTKLWLLVLAVLVYVGGIVLKQLALEQPMLYVYGIAGDRLKVSVTTVFGKETLLLNVSTEEIIGVGESRIPAVGSLLATDQKDVKALYFVKEGNTYELLFSPDDYMLAILKDKVGE